MHERIGRRVSEDNRNCTCAAAHPRQDKPVKLIIDRTNQAEIGFPVIIVITRDNNVGGESEINVLNRRGLRLKQIENRTAVAEISLCAEVVFAVAVIIARRDKIADCSPGHGGDDPVRVVQTAAIKPSALRRRDRAGTINRHVRFIVAVIVADNRRVIEVLSESINPNGVGLTLQDVKSGLCCRSGPPHRDVVFAVAVVVFRHEEIRSKTPRRRALSGHAVVLNKPRYLSRRSAARITNNGIIGFAVAVHINGGFTQNSLRTGRLNHPNIARKIVRIARRICRQIRFEFFLLQRLESPAHHQFRI